MNINIAKNEIIVPTVDTIFQLKYVTVLSEYWCGMTMPYTGPPYPRGARSAAFHT